MKNIIDYHDTKDIYCTLRDVTRTVVGLLESTSSYPLVVSEDASLKTLAAARIKRRKEESQYLLQPIDGQRHGLFHLLSMGVYPPTAWRLVTNLAISRVQRRAAVSEPATCRYRLES